MADQAKINSIDQTQVANGYVVAECDVTVGSTVYPQQFTISATDPVGVYNGVHEQAEIYKNQVLEAAPQAQQAADLNALVGEIISL